MDKIRPFLIAVPAFLLGALATATLTTTARAQAKTSDEAPVYRVAYGELELNKYAKQGYVIKEATGTANTVYYLMQRIR